MAFREPVWTIRAVALLIVAGVCFIAARWVIDRSRIGYCALLIGGGMAAILSAVLVGRDK